MLNYRVDSHFICFFLMQMLEGILNLCQNCERCLPILTVISLCSTFAISSRLRQFTRLPADSSSLFHWLTQGSHSFLNEPGKKKLHLVLCCDFGLFSYILEKKKKPSRLTVVTMMVCESQCMYFILHMV